MARVPARPFSTAGSRLGDGYPSGPGGRAGGDISGTWMVSVNGHGQSQYLFEYSPSGEVTGKGKPAAGGAWLSDLKGFHEQGGKLTWTSYVNNREAGRFEANVVGDLTSFNGTGTLITGMRLNFSGTRTTPVPATARANSGLGALPMPAARPQPQALVQETNISMQDVSHAAPSATAVRAEQDAEYQIALIRDQAKDLENQLSKARSELSPLNEEVDAINLKLQNINGQRARYGENPKNTAELEKAQADLDEAQRPVDEKKAKVSSLQEDLEEKNDLLAAVMMALE